MWYINIHGTRGSIELRLHQKCRYLVHRYNNVLYSNRRQAPFIHRQRRQCWNLYQKNVRIRVAGCSKRFFVACKKFVHKVDQDPVKSEVHSERSVTTSVDHKKKWRWHSNELAWASQLLWSWTEAKKQIISYVLHWKCRILKCAIYSKCFFTCYVRWEEKMS